MSFLNILGGAEKPKGPPELDKTIEETRRSLEELRGEVDISRIMQAFEKDLDELGIKDKREREEYKRKLESAFISESLELENVNDFIDNFAEYTKLDELIEQCKQENSGGPLERWAKTLQNRVPWLANAIGWIISFKVGEPKEGEQQSRLDTKLASLAAILTGEAPAVANPETSVAIEQEKGDIEVSGGTSREAVENAFQEAGLKFNGEKYEEDIAYLYQNGIKEAEQVTALISRAVESGIIKSIKENMDGNMESIKLSLTDIYLFADKLKGQQDTVIEGMEKIPKNPESINQYLVAVREYPRDNDAITKYLQSIEGSAV